MQHVTSKLKILFVLFYCAFVLSYHKQFCVLWNEFDTAPHSNDIETNILASSQLIHFKPYAI